MALTQISTQGIKDGTITGSDFATNIDLVDNQKLRLGTGNDLEIYHDGGGSIIKDSGTGDLRIGGDGDLLIMNAALDETKAKFSSNGAAELYHDNENKLFTKANGVQVQDTSATGAYLTMATSSGTAGKLYATGDNTLGFLDSQNHYMLKAIKDGAVELYHDNSKKFETTSSGNKATGKLGIDDGDGSSGNYLSLGTSDDLKIYHSGSHSYINHSGTGNLYIDGNTDDLVLQAGDDVRIQTQGNEDAINCVGNGAVELYYDNSKKFETTSLGVTVSGRLDTQGLFTGDNNKILVGNSDDLQIYHDGTYNRFESGATTVLFRSNLIEFGDNSGNKYIKCIDAGATELYHDGSKRLSTLTSGIKVERPDATVSFITMATSDGDCGFLYANSNTDIQLMDREGHPFLKGIKDGAVELYHDNSKKFETTSDGAKVIGNLVLDDNNEIRLGSDATNGDLQIYHNGTDNFIDTDAGSIKIRVNANENAITAASNGEVELYHDNQTRLSTRGGGVDLRREAEVFVQMARTNNSQTDGDFVSSLIGLGKDDANNFTEYSKMTTQIIDASNGTEDGRLSMLTMKNGTMTTAATIEAGYFQRNNAPGFAGEAFQWVNTNPNMHNGSIKFTSGDFNNSTGIFTCPVAGKYLCMATVQSHRANDNTGASTQYFNVLFQKNNSNYFGETVGTQHADGGSSGGTPSNHFQITQSVIVDCAVNDTIRAHSNHGYRYGVQNQLCIMLLA